MAFNKIILIFVLNLIFTNVMHGEKNKLKEILKNDLFQKSSSKKIKTKINESPKPKAFSNEIVDTNDLTRVIKNLWLIRNNFVLKWDKKLPDYGLEKTFEEVFEAFGAKGFKYKILFVHTNLVTHQMIKMSENEFIFIISKIFAEQLDLTKQEISVLLLEAYVREKVKEKNVEIGEFSPSIGKNFKHKINDYIQGELKKIDADIFNYKGSFDIESVILKNMFNGLSSKKVYLKNYRRMLGKVDDLLRSDVRFKYFASRYPSPEIKINWLEGMNVK